MTPTHPVLYLVDGSSYIYRAFFAIGHLTNSKGMPTQAVYGFTQMIRKILQEKAPEYLVIAFDAKGPTFRHELYQDYKSHRPSMPDGLQIQIPYIKEISRGYGIPILEKAGYEADDLIGTLAKKAEAQGFEVVIVSGDKDLMQLVSPRVRMWDTMKDQVIDLAEIQKRFGIEPDKLIEVMGLSGDSTDNIPGVPGIGPKTALKLIQSHGSLEALLDHSRELSPKVRDRIVSFKEQALLSRRLATVDTELPLDLSPEALKVRPMDSRRLKTLFEELEFKKQLDELGEVQEVRSQPREYRALTDLNELRQTIKEIRKAGQVSLDLETTSQHPTEAEIVGIALSYQEGSAVYLPVGHEYLGAPVQPSLERVLDALREIIEDPGIRKIGQNMKYEWIVLRRYDLSYEGLSFDTMIASYLLNPSRRAHNLGQIAWECLNQKLIGYKDLVGTGAKAKKFSEVPVEVAVEYAGQDAEVALTCAGRLAPSLKAEGLEELFHRLEMPLIPVLGEMERHGVRIDSRALSELSREMESKLRQMEERIYELAGERFNINSSQQLCTILFEKHQMPQGKKTKGRTRFSTDAEVLQELAAQYPLAEAVWNYRILNKLKSTYVDALPKLVNPGTGRLHTSFNQTITATGRLSSSEPNLQNIPVRTEEGRRIRQAFVTDPGCLLLSADYSQIELRILAHYSRDAGLVSAFEQGQDVHRRTAADIFNVPADQVTPDMRRVAKTINFGIFYGMSAYGLSRELRISTREAQEAIDRYFGRYQGVRAYIEQTLAEARRTQMVTTLFNRRRRIEGIDSPNRVTRQFAERTAVNTPIQGTAADIIKKAMIRIHQAMKKQGLSSRMILQVHDELVFEVPESELPVLQSLVQEHMETVVSLRVPLVVQISHGANWAELK